MSQMNLNKDNYKFLESDNLNIDTPKFSLKGYKTYGKCVKVYDGDTIHAIFKMPNSNDCYKWIIRLNGIDTPEIKSANTNEKECAKQIKKYLSDLILNKLIVIDCLEFDKYGRLLANVYFQDELINNTLIQKGYAKVYDGGHKSEWQDDQLKL